jgi:hypothetical protein
VFFTEGDGGRPGDTDHPAVSSLDVRAFKLWAAHGRARAWVRWVWRVPCGWVFARNARQSPTTPNARNGCVRPPLPRRGMPRRSTPAQPFEIDDVIDPADTRALIAATLTAAVNAPRSTRARFVDTW